MTQNQHESEQGVTSICWCSVPAKLTSWWAAGEGTRLAIWPAPVDHDTCFSAAGFAEFADSGDERDVTIEKMTATLLAELSRVGEPRQRAGEIPVWAPGVFRRLFAKLRRNAPTPTLGDIVLCPMRDDNFQPCVIGFGQGPAAMLCTASGHDIWWIYLAPHVGEGAPRLLEALADGRPIRRVDVDLAHLAPAPRHAV